MDTKTEVLAIDEDGNYTVRAWVLNYSPRNRKHWLMPQEDSLSGWYVNADFEVVSR